MLLQRETSQDERKPSGLRNTRYGNDKHYPAGTPEGKGGQFAPKNSSSDSAAKVAKGTETEEKRDKEAARLQPIFEELIRRPSEEGKILLQFAALGDWKIELGNTRLPEIDRDKKIIRIPDNSSTGRGVRKRTHEEIAKDLDDTLSKAFAAELNELEEESLRSWGKKRGWKIEYGGVRTVSVDHESSTIRVPLGASTGKGSRKLSPDEIKKSVTTTLRSLFVQEIHEAKERQEYENLNGYDFNELSDGWKRYAVARTGMVQSIGSFVKYGENAIRGETLSGEKLSDAQRMLLFSFAAADALSIAVPIAKGGVGLATKLGAGRVAGTAVGKVLATDVLFGAGEATTKRLSESAVGKALINAYAKVHNAKWNNWGKSPKAPILKSFEDIVKYPQGLFGKSEEEVAELLGEGWKRGRYGKTGTGWSFTKGDRLVFFHQNGRHKGTYYGFSTGVTGKVKIVGKDYVPLPGDKATVLPAPSSVSFGVPPLPPISSMVSPLPGAEERK